METVIIILFFLVVLFGYFSYNLFRKTERLEKIADKQEEYINAFSELIKQSAIKLKEIDERGSFESDDEIGWFFEGIKQIQNKLNNFIIEKNGE